MKAALWYSAGDVRIEEVPEPTCGSKDVKLKVKWCGICGTDIHEYNAGPIFIPVGTPHVATGAVAPVILGHEFSGEVVEVGSEVTKFKPGDRVVVEPLVACGTCPSCKAGKTNLCETLAFHGLQNTGGACAEYTTFTEDFVHHMPDSLSYEKGSLVEPISVGYHSLKVGRFQKGDIAVVSGAGPIGLATVECLKAMGASKIIMVQRKSVRQQYALNSGADCVVDPTEVDVVSEIKRLTDGVGADIAFETTASEDIYHKLFDCLKVAGTLVVTSVWEAPISLHLNNLVLSEKYVVGSVCYTHEDYKEVIEMMADGRIPANGYITKKIHLDDIVKEGFEFMNGPEKKKQVKLIVTPDKSLLD